MRGMPLKPTLPTPPAATLAVPTGIIVDHFAAARRSLRIAFVTETYPPEVNGVAMTLARVVDGLHQRNHDVQLIRPRQPGQDGASGTDASSGLRFHEVLMRGLPIPRYPNLRMGVPSKKALIKLWSTQRPDVVHIATEGPLGWSALQAASSLKLPISTDFRTNFHAYSKHYGIGWLHKPIMAYLRKFHNRAHCTMVPTEALRRDLDSYGFKDLRVVARGVDTQQFNSARRSAELRQSWGAAENDLIVSCVGRLAPEKNLNTLLAAFAAVRQVQPRAKLLLVGEGPLRAELQARCPEALFAGQRHGSDLAAHYASADLFLFPSLTETFGNVTLEAMASGLPVVAFNYAAAAELISHGEDGWLAPCQDAAAFVQHAVNAAQDLARCRQMGERARQRAQALDWPSIVMRFEDALAGVMQRQAEPASGPGLRLRARHDPAA
jgi:glycosyltransferase involved in cell wall biosynthesis